MSRAGRLDADVSVSSLADVPDDAFALSKRRRALVLNFGAERLEWQRLVL